MRVPIFLEKLATVISRPPHTSNYREPSQQVRAICRKRSPLRLVRDGVPLQQTALQVLRPSCPNLVQSGPVRSATDGLGPVGEALVYREVADEHDAHHMWPRPERHHLGAHVKVARQVKGPERLGAAPFAQRLHSSML